MRVSGGILVETSESSLCGVVVAVAATENRRQRLNLEKLEVDKTVRDEEGNGLEERERVLMVEDLKKRGRTVVFIPERRRQQVVKLMNVVAMSIDSVAIFFVFELVIAGIPVWGEKDETEEQERRLIFGRGLWRFYLRFVYFLIAWDFSQELS